MAIPELDLQHLSLTKLDAACADWGFFALRGHGLPPALIAEVMAQSRAFFTQPQAAKDQIRRTASNAWGYYDAELTKNRRDWKEIIDIGPPVNTGPLQGSTPQWPALDGFADCMQELSQALHEIALNLVAAIAEALGSQVDLIAPFQRHSSFLRLNYYPPCPTPAAPDADFVPEHGELGISHHTDAGAVTVLLQDEQPGLQVYQNQRWHTVMPVHEGLIINIGDIVQVWSNDRYRAPLHRVLANADTARISTPYFLNPAYDYDYAPLSDVATGEITPLYRPINWGHFRQQRSAGDYADHGTEIQISDFRLANRQL